MLVSDREIRKYNRTYLHRNAPTDVMAFPMGEVGILGDVLISTETARRQAREAGHSLLTEVKILAIHGLLHLVGYCDKTKKDRLKMWRETDRLLELVREI